MDKKIRSFFAVIGFLIMISALYGGRHLTNYKIAITPVPDLKNKYGDELRLYIYTCVLDENKLSYCKRSGYSFQISHEIIDKVEIS